MIERDRKFDDRNESVKMSIIRTGKFTKPSAINWIEINEKSVNNQEKWLKSNNNEKKQK